MHSPQWNLQMIAEMLFDAQRMPLEVLIRHGNGPFFWLIVHSMCFIFTHRCAHFERERNSTNGNITATTNNNNNSQKNRSLFSQLVSYIQAVDYIQEKHNRESSIFLSFVFRLFFLQAKNMLLSPNNHFSIKIYSVYLEKCMKSFCMKNDNQSQRNHTAFWISISKT